MTREEATRRAIAVQDEIDRQASVVIGYVSRTAVIADAIQQAARDEAAIYVEEQAMKDYRKIATETFKAAERLRDASAKSAKDLSCKCERCSVIRDSLTLAVESYDLAKSGDKEPE